MPQARISVNDSTKTARPGPKTRSRSLCISSRLYGRNGGCGSRTRRGADIDHIAVTGRGILVDKPRHKDAAVEGNDFAILFAGNRSGRADVVLAARAALEPQFLRSRLVGQMHDNAARRSDGDDIRLLALPLR